jgi:hypothetical protein
MGLIFGEKSAPEDMVSSQRLAYQRPAMEPVVRVKRNLNASTAMDQDPSRVGQSLGLESSKNVVPRPVREEMKKVYADSLKPRPPRSNASNVDCSITGAKFTGNTEYNDAVGGQPSRSTTFLSTSAHAGATVGKSTFNPPVNPITGKPRTLPTPIFEQPPPGGHAKHVSLDSVKRGEERALTMYRK